MGMFGRKGKGGPEMDLAEMSTQQLKEQAEYWKKCSEEEPSSKLAKQFYRKYEYHLRRRPDFQDA